MSITPSLPQLPRQKESGGELDVFEAVAYFSAAANESFIPPNKMMRSSHGRMSLDIPMMTSSFPSQRHKTIKDIDDHKTKNKKQPNSPGGKLASFFASLFKQTYSKKKKSTTKNIKDDQDHDQVGRRKRRSSITHFQSVNTTFSNSFYSSSNSQLPCPNTLTKTSLEDFETHNNFHVQSPSLYRKVDDKKINNSESSWLDAEKFEFGINSNEFSLQKYNTFANGVLGDHTIDHSSHDLRNFRHWIKDEDEEAESDSSSDLFELQNYDLVSCYSSDLPVYETTNIDSINYQERCTDC